MAPTLQSPSDNFYHGHPKKIPPVAIIIGIFLVLILSIGLTLYFRIMGHPHHGFNFTPSVTVATVEVKTLPVTYETVGSLEANQQIDIKPETPGLIRQIYFKEGEQVHQGQPLVRLEHDKQSADIEEAQSNISQAKASMESVQDDYQSKLASLQQAKAQENLAQAEYKRYKTLWNKQFISAQDLDEKKTTYQVAKANYTAIAMEKNSALSRLQQAKAAVQSATAHFQHTQYDYADTLIDAPFSGIIGLKQINIGDYVIPTQKLLTLVQSDPLKVTLGVPERYLDQLKMGMPVDIQAENDPNKTVTGHIIFIDPMVSQDTRSVTVKALIQNPQNVLKPGQYANIKVILAYKKDALIVPEESLIPQGEKYYVYVADHGKAMYQPVKTGIRIPGWVEITQGLQAHQEVLTGGIQKVREGSPIKIISSNSATESDTEAGP